MTITLEHATAEGAKVWIVVHGRLELIDSALSPERLENGHFFVFDGGMSDPEDPYTCGLCGEAKWKVYRDPCAQARPLAELNADRSAWIEKHLYDGKPEWRLIEWVSRYHASGRADQLPQELRTFTARSRRLRDHLAALEGAAA